MEGVNMAEKEYKVGQRMDGQKRLAKLIMSHYGGALEIDKTRSQPIAWVSAGAPNELLWAMDFFIQFPEAYAATCGARHFGHTHCEITEAHGYEHHLCTYCRNSLGSTIALQEGKETFEPLARPDVLIVANSSCILITKWWEHLSHLWNIPLFNIDCPLVVSEDNEKEIDLFGRDIFFYRINSNFHSFFKDIPGFPEIQFKSTVLNEIIEEYLIY